MTRLAPPCAALALAACAGSTPTRFWTIEPVNARPVVGAVRMVGPLRVDAVHVPLAIDRLEVVQHDVENRVTVHDFDRWSAPPGDLIQRALTQDLQARLPAGSVIFPASPKPAGAAGIVIDILDIRQTGSGYAMNVAWSAAGGNGAPAGLRRQLTLQSDGAADVAGQSAALGRLIGQLADSIAGAFTVPSTPGNLGRSSVR